jgi:hypothetical protein
MYTYEICYVFSNVHDDYTFVAIGKNLHILLLETYKVECFTIRAERKKRNIVFLVDVDRESTMHLGDGNPKVKVLYSLPKVDRTRVVVDGLVGIEVKMESDVHDDAGKEKAAASMAKYLTRCGVRKVAFHIPAFTCREVLERHKRKWGVQECGKKVELPKVSEEGVWGEKSISM